VAGGQDTAISRDNRNLLIALACLLAVVFAFVGSNVAANHEPRPHDMPVGIVGSANEAAALAGQLERAAPGGFKVTPYKSRGTARTAILHRRIYGAYDPGPRPLLMVASAASIPAELVVHRTFESAARARGQSVEVRDLAPLPPSDSSGATAFSVILSLIIAGVLGTSVLYMVTRQRGLRERFAAVLALGIGAGLVTAFATNVVVGAFAGHFLAVWGVATLFVLAVAVPVASFQVLLGLPGTAVGFIVFLVIGDPSSGGGSAPELLPGFWRAISQQLPPGAGTGALRDVVYFHGHGMTRALVVLSIYVVAGTVGTIAVHTLRVAPGWRARTRKFAARPHNVAATRREW
jgi:hypothetical protein